jgi:hypothetical protein
LHTLTAAAAAAASDRAAEDDDGDGDFQPSTSTITAALATTVALPPVVGGAASNPPLYAQYSGDGGGGGVSGGGGKKTPFRFLQRGEQSMSTQKLKIAHGHEQVSMFGAGTTVGGASVLVESAKMTTRSRLAAVKAALSDRHAGKEWRLQGVLCDIM